MTLIELLISISLLTIVMAGLVTAMLIVLDTTDTTRQTVTDSSGAQLLTSYLVSDAQAADTVQPSPSCAADRLLELRWTDADKSIGTVTDVVYIVEAGATGNSQLARYSYTVSGGACVQTGKAVMVRAVDPGATATKASCAPSACDDSAVRVGLTVTALSTEPHTGNYTSFKFDVLGSRRTK